MCTDFQSTALTDLEELEIQENRFAVSTKDIPGLGLMGMIKYFQACAMSQFTKNIILNVMGITEIPKEVLGYTMLTSISLMGNRLTQIPDAFGNLTHLRRVSLRSNQLTMVPESFTRLANSVDHLDLSYNEFTLFPSPVCELKSVVFLDFSHNQLQSVHDAIGAMLALEHMRLDYNRLKMLPGGFGRLPSLHTLNLRYNKLSDLKGALAGATTLTNLDMRDNNLLKVPPEIGGLTNLVRLALANNFLSKLPSEMGELRLLRDLSISGNQVKVPNQEILDSGMDFVLEYLYSLGQSADRGELLLDGMAMSLFPMDVLEVKTLVHLSVCSNHIAAIPEGINKLVTLQRLFVSDNRIEVLPDNLVLLEGLVILEAEKNLLSALPKRFGFLPDVEVLVLNRNNFSVVPLELGYLKKLRRLDLEGNLLMYPFNILFARGFSHVFRFLDTVANTAESKCIELGGIQFPKIPDALEEENYAERIVLHGNDMSEVPAFVYSPEFTSLKRLTLSENNLKELPVQVYNITTLTHLDLEYNRIRNLPDFIGNLSLLTELNICNNTIVSLPQIMSSKLTGLRYFNADTNFIRSVPSLSNMTALLVLSVMDNRLSSLDSCEAHTCAQLREIWVSRNEITLLPPWLCDRRVIEYIDIPLRDVDPAEGEDAVSLKMKTKDAIRIWVPGLRMDLSNLGLEDIPNDIWRKAEIGNLNCSGNRLSEVSKQIGILVNLTQVYFVHNRLDDLPDAFGTLVALKTCRLDHNFFEEIPRCVYKLRNLEKLTMSFNSIKHYIEASIGQLQELKVLWLNNNELEGFHEEIGKLRGLTEIVASENQIAELPDNFQYLTNLQRLRLEYNQLSSICLPFALGNLTAITDLRVAKNPIPEDEVAIVAKGSQYVARFNRALYLSEGIVAEGVHELDLGVLALATLPRSVCKLDFLVFLNCADNQLRELPCEIAELVNLTYLDCSRNLMTSLPPEMSHMQLETLLMSENKLFSLPAVVYQIGCKIVHQEGDDAEAQGIPTLRMLDISRNIVINLPSGLGSMVDLEVLRINSNKIRHLSHVIENLQSLQVLDARENSLPALPVEIGHCTALVELYVDHNELIAVPGTLGNLTNLTRLGVSYNQITSFPLAMSNLTMLERLDYEHNDISVPCRFIRDKGATIMLKYMHAIVMSTQSAMLSLASYSMLDVPAEVFAYKGASALTKLSLYENRFGPSLPDEISLKMPHLGVIDATRNLLSTLPGSLTKLQHLRALLVNENKFEEWPPVLWDLTNLETLAIEDNLLTGIPGEVMRLKRLDNFR